MLKYKGYFGEVRYDPQAKLFHGQVIGLKDIITFQGTDAQEIERAFRESIDDYLAWCKERSERPEKSYSGNVRLRMDPRLHAHLALEAARQGISLNELINAKIRK